MYEIRYQDVIKLSSAQIKKYIDAVKENVEKLLASMTISENLKKSREQILERITNSVNVIINANQINLSEINLKSFSEVVEKGKQLGLAVNFYVTGGSEFNSTEKINLLFNEKDLNKLNELNSLLLERGESGLKFIEDANFPDRAWALQDVVEANSKIDEVVNFIKSKEMSPFEAAAYIHKMAQSKFSYCNGAFDTLNVSCIVDITKSKETICFGYAKYCKAIADKLNNPSLVYQTFMSKLAVEKSGCKLAEKLGFSILPSGHVQNVIKIYDSKYAVNGVYVSDACFDCKDEEYKNGKGFSNFMFAVEDLLKYKSLKFSQPYSSVESVVCGYNEQESEPNIVKFNKAISKPIDKSKFYNCLKSVYSSMYSGESCEQVEKRVGEQIETSQKVSTALFSQASNNVFISKTSNKSNNKEK